MIRAIDISTDKSIYAYDVIERGKYVCPFCNSKVMWVDSNYRIQHFRHYNEGCEFNTKPESEEHNYMKMKCVKLFKGLAEVKIGNRIADVVVDNVVIECQCSSLTSNEIYERTKDYNKSVYYVLWLFGGSYYKYSKINNFLKISQTIYNIFKMYRGRVYFMNKTKIFPICYFQQKRWIEDNGYGGGYYKWYKLTKKSKKGIINNFNFLKVEYNFKLARFFDKKMVDINE